MGARRVCAAGVGRLYASLAPGGGCRWPLAGQPRQQPARCKTWPLKVLSVFRPHRSRSGRARMDLYLDDRAGDQWEIIRRIIEL